MNITHDKATRQGDWWLVETTITADDGTTSRMLHRFPAETMEWRAAEYGIDPTDVETLLGIVMVEPWLTPDDWAAGSQLYDGTADVATAQKDHLKRCAAAKKRTNITTRPATPKAAHPLDPIRADHGIDLEVVALKTEHVRRIRAGIQADQNKPKQQVDRAAQWKQRLADEDQRRKGNRDGHHNN